VKLDITDTEAENELKLEGQIIIKCIRIKTQEDTTSYMVRVLTNYQQTKPGLTYTRRVKGSNHFALHHHYQ